VHLLLALVEDREGVIPSVLEKIGVPTERLETELHQIEEKLLGWLVRRRSLGESDAQQGSRSGLPRGGKLQGRIRFHGAFIAGVAHTKGESAHEALASVGATHEAILQALTAVRGRSA